MAVKSAEVSSSASLQKEREVYSNLRRNACIIQCYGDEITIGSSGTMALNLILEHGSGGTLAHRIKESGGNGLGELESSLDLAKIGDLGLARRVSISKKRKLGVCCWEGTLMYLSPEAVTDHVQEAPSDVWAVGCIVHEMLTGKSPLKGKEEELEILRKIGEGREVIEIAMECLDDVDDHDSVVDESVPFDQIESFALVYDDDDDEYTSDSSTEEWSHRSETESGDAQFLSQQNAPLA
ncbi:hypothetical protein SASPL_148422 [Salvia splendens]|uniref:Protein kinase domain-containing protein n=1 Tax=Salvia splendens TaxID=180675 RepID=A0A8X8W9B0_SALSN|nr:hypothetical protein SASPL_148422 [Salvia splendens]